MDVEVRVRAWIAELEAFNVEAAAAQLEADGAHMPEVIAQTAIGTLLLTFVLESTPIPDAREAAHELAHAALRAGGAADTASVRVQVRGT